MRSEERKKTGRKIRGSESRTTKMKENREKNREFVRRRKEESRKEVRGGQKTTQMKHTTKQRERH